MEGVEDVGSALVAHREPAEAGEPGVGPFHDPAMPAQALAALDPTPRDARDDPALAAGAATAGIVVALIGVQLARAAARPASALPDQGRASSIGSSMVLSCTFAAVRRERAGARWHQPGCAACCPACRDRSGSGPVASPPLLPGHPRRRANTGSSRSRSLAATGRAGRGATSPTHRLPASRASAASSSCPSRNPSLAAHLPGGCPICARTGPVNAVRFGTGGRPPHGRGSGGGSRASISAHSASLTRGLAMAAQPPPAAARSKRSPKPDDPGASLPQLRC
jgi:hypothetical protein